MMGDAPPSEAGSANAEATKDIRLDMDSRLFGGLEFQVSEVVGRLEAGVNAQDRPPSEEKPERRKISAGFFEPEAVPLGEILDSLEDTVRRTDPASDSPEPPLLPVDAAGQAAILAHSVAALLGRLERGHAARVGAHVAADTTRWLAHMFRLPDYHAFYHPEQLEGLVRVTRMLLHHKYPRYLEDGALALAAREPCVYAAAAGAGGAAQHVCRQLGLPLRCVRPLPALDTGGVDVAALGALVDADAAAGRAPLLLLAGAGAAPLGRGAELRALRAACVARALHLHLAGHALALPAALAALPQDIAIADSLTLTPGSWFGVPGLPTVTFYKVPQPSTADETSAVVGSREGTLAALGGLAGGAARAPALPLWAAARVSGARRLVARLQAAFRSARTFYAIVENAGLRILSERPGGDEPPNTDIIDAMSRAAACVAFQFAPAECAGAGAPRPPPYYDKLNSWLGQVLQREADMISIEVCETEQHGVILRHCPLEGAVLAEPRAAELAAALDAQLHVLRATVALREEFREAARAHDTLRLVNVPHWAGLGGVRYVPTNWAGGDEELSALNRRLVDELRRTDAAFSCGEGADGLAAVRFGMVTADTDVRELTQLVAAAGAELEDSSRRLTTMGELLKKGIEEAQLDLQRESAERLWAAVPVVGRVVGWWAAPPAPPPGRRLQLQLGRVQTTADVYDSVQRRKEQDAAPAAAHPARDPTDPADPADPTDPADPDPAAPAH